MRDSLDGVNPSDAEKRSDALLWLALLLSPVAMGVNTVVGYTVAHWTTDTAQKRVAFLVSAIDFALCICAFAISLSFYRHGRDGDDAQAVDGLRVFIAQLSMLLCLLAALLVIAGTIAVVILHPTD